MITKIVKKFYYAYFLLRYYLVLIKFFLFTKFPVFLTQIKLLIDELTKFTKIWARKIYVWRVLSVRNGWYLSKNSNHYNPTLQATVYKSYRDGWNIARFNVHYEGYKTKKLAQEAAFKMWMKERFKNKNILKSENKSYEFLLQKELPKTEKVGEPLIGFIRQKNEWLVTRLGDIELRLFYDSEKWHLNWVEYDKILECDDKGWCHTRNCHFDLMDLNTVDPKDGSCKECLGIKVEIITSDYLYGGEWTNPPSDLEDARRNILNEYRTLPHNGLENYCFYKIMHSKWVYISS